MSDLGQPSPQSSPEPSPLSSPTRLLSPSLGTRGENGKRKDWASHFRTEELGFILNYLSLYT